MQIYIYIYIYTRNLVHIALDAGLGQVLAAAADELVDVHVHELKHQRQPARRLDSMILYVCVI